MRIDIRCGKRFQPSNVVAFVTSITPEPDNMMSPVSGVYFGFVATSVSTRNVHRFGYPGYLHERIDSA